jgi:threonine-phosphate decarboxylase
MIDYTSGANPLGPSNKARNAIRSLVRQISTISPQRLNHLKGYIAKKEGIDEACISFGCGSTAILNTILERINPKKILIPHPVSKRHSAILSRHSLECTTVPLKADENFDLTVEDFCNAMHGCDAALLPHPHDVTGTVIPPEDIIKIVDKADGLGVHLVVDETYAEYTGMPPLAVRFSNSDKALMLRTFSTFHALGGLRLGYIIGPPDFINQIETRLDPSWINSFASWAAIASMKDKGYRRRTLLFIEGEKAYMREKLSWIKDVKCFVSPSNMLVIKLQKESNDVQKLFERHMILIDTFTDDYENTCIRFPVQTHRMNAYFVRILKRIMEA